MTEPARFRYTELMLNKGGSGMDRIALGFVGLTALVSLIPGTGIIETFSPIVNSGSGVLAVAFIAGIYSYRRIQENKKEKQQENHQEDNRKK